jgi:hypothetical protein
VAENDEKVVLGRELRKLKLDAKVLDRVESASRLISESEAASIVQGLKTTPRDQRWVVERFMKALR